ncbi:MAG TPA: cation:proton antiporter, partial [Bacteroidales bacterium]|nr:cation:proton antiporter [Bacteroidales bacterium]HPH75623.1 cation:proton antiporter [Bacteroidales bacterium]HQN59720.1 cation:proton antiporter [Bacteroidales bacterium]
MTNYIILALCVIIILSYLFDISSRYSRIPGIILLIGLGIALQLISLSTGLSIPNLKPILPVIGTLGLVMIVLDASLDLKLEKKKSRVLINTVLSALVLLILVVTIGSLVLVKIFGHTPISAVLNMIPLGIISSAAAIPSAEGLSSKEKEFIVYESSFSDILGIMAFDFILLGQSEMNLGVGNFLIAGFLTIVIAAVTTVGLAWLLHKANYHVNYVIIMTFVVLVYVLAELYHLPALLLVLVFGLALSNNRIVENTFISRYIEFGKFNRDLNAFRRILGELTFLVRSFFFIIFGYYTSVEGVFYPENLITAFIITAGILLIRWLFFYCILRIKSLPLVLFAPRGLITILLFLSIPAAYMIPEINTEVITLVILMTLLAMMLGNIISPRKAKRVVSAAKTD